MQFVLLGEEIGLAYVYNCTLLYQLVEHVDFKNILTPKFCQILRLTYNVIMMITQITIRRLATCHV